MKCVVLYCVAVLRQTAIVCVLAFAWFFQTQGVEGAGCSAPFFVAGATYPADMQPASVAIGDFNRDGKLDLVVADQFSADISVLIGRGDGTYLAAVNYPAGTAPSAVVARDFNGDGKLDLALTDASSFEVWVMLGNGDGTFQTAVPYDLSGPCNAITTGDFNNDGKVDLAVALRGNGSVAILLGTGTGTFGAATEILVGADPVAILAADFDKDGKLDIATANASLGDVTLSSISILRGRGTGAFFSEVEYPAGYSPRSLAVGDFNKDGKLDLAVANYGYYNGVFFTNGNLTLLNGDGTGGFAAPVNYNAGVGPVFVLATNLNNDTNIDLVVANDQSTEISVFYAAANGTFQAPLTFDTGVPPHVLAAADLNGDGLIDLTTPSDPGELIIFATCVTADLGITGTDAPDPVPLGNNVTYTFSVTNSGPDTAPDATFTDRLPSGLSFVSFTTTQGSCSNNAGTVTCALGNMTNGARATVTITTTTTLAGSISSTGTVSSVLRPDAFMNNNNAILTTTVLPVVSVAATDPTASEAGPTSGTFTISRSGGSSGSVTVNYTVSGTASPGVDYSTLSGSATIANGFTSVNVTVSPIDDNVAENDETVILTLSSSTNYTINGASSSATVTILDNDVFPVSINDVSVTEGNSGTVSAVFTVTLGGSSAQTVTVNYATANGTAVAGSDYVATNGSLSFAPGVTTKTITVPVLGDSLNEANETFFVNLSNPVNATIGDGQGVGTINNDDPVPSLSINDVTVQEGISGTTNAIFTVTLSAVSGQTVTINYATADGTATAGSDYAATSGTLSFPAGTTTRTITVVVNGDSVPELDETFFVNLSAAANAGIADSQGVGTIRNASPGISIGNVAVSEGDSGTIGAVFTVSLSFASAQTVTVTYATADGSAIAGADYIATNGLVSFAPNTTNQTVTVQVVGDLLNEINETFFVNLSNSTNAIIATSQGTGTINNDDPLPSLSINDVAVTEGSSGSVNALFTVSLSAASGQTVTANWATANGTAVAGSDYTAASGTVTFAPGVTTQTISVNVSGDTLNEANETFFVNLSNPGNAVIGDSQGIGTINNDDPLPNLSINDVSVTEGNSGTVTAVFTVTLSPVSGQAVSVNYATANGTATAGSDYVATSGTLNFPAGTTTQTISVTVNGDVLNEADETFFVNLSNPANALFSDSQGTGTILNDDPLPSLSINDVTVTEGNSGTINAVFTVTLSAVSGRTVTVNYATVDGTAVSGSDYVAASGTLTFAAGVTTQTISVAVNGDTINEINESFSVNLSGAVNATLADSQGVATILNDDPLPTLSINDASVTEPNSGTVNAVFTVTLSSVSGQTVTVNYGTADGTAIAGSDYLSTSGVVTFAPGVASQTVNVAVVGDTLNEANETFQVNLSNPVNATLNRSQGTGTINNDDPLPAISINDVTLSEGNVGTNAVFSVRLSAASGQTVSVSYSTADGTATAGSDYAATNGVVTFPPGTTNQNVSVFVVGDQSNEPNETFFVNLLNAVNGTISDSQGLGTINNDDPVPVITIADAAVFEGNSLTTVMPFAVRLSAPSAFTITVSYATVDGTAARNSDYTRIVSGTLTFAPGVSTQFVNVSINGDTQVETNETLFVTLSSPVNATLGNTQATGWILNDDGVPSMTISDATVTEGNSGTTPAVFNVRLTAASTQPVWVNYSTADGTATAGSDYFATSGLLTFAPGVTNQTITVQVIGDQFNEANETFFVNLSGSTNALISDAQGLGTINNDDFQPNLSINDVSVAEGDSGTTAMTFTVSLSPTSSQIVTVNYATADGTANAGSDYVATSGTLSIPAGAASGTITISVIGDTINEPNETLFVNLSNPTNAMVLDGQGIGTINNDDAGPAVSIGDVSVVEGNSGTTNANFTVSLSQVSGQTVTVSYATTNGTALAGSDYVATNGVVTFAPGTTSQTVTVKVNGDLVNEANETFFVNLSNPSNASIGDGQGLGTIVNDDPLPTLSINDVSVNEGNSGTTDAVFTVTISPASGQNVTVNYATADGTANVGSDYVTANGTLTIPAGATSQTIIVKVLGDTVGEANETFFLNLSSPTNATIADGQGIGTILNDDAVSGISINDISVTEGNSGTTAASFTVSLSGASGQTVTVNYATADGSATAGSDYVATNGVVTFAPGTTSQSVLVNINGDTTAEADETFFVNLSNPVNGTLADSQGIGTILNDDALPTLSINNVAVAEGNAGTSDAVFSVSLSPASGQTVTVNYATANGTATAGSDYISTNGALTFSPGTTSQTITVKVIGDLVNEANETFFVNLSSAANAILGVSQGTGTINNDDPVQALSINDVSVIEGNSGTTNALFRVTLSSASGQTVTVRYATADGTALAGSDYVATNGLLTFASGTTTQFVTVRVNGDTAFEADETFFVNLSNPTNASFADSQAIGTILNDDGLPGLSINNVTLTEGNSGTTDAVFTVTLSASSSSSITANYATANGTAAAGADYIATNGLVTFAPGTTSQTITVKVIGDLLNEANETFFVNLSNPTNAALTTSQGRGTINDDDALPSLFIADQAVNEGNSGTTNATFSLTLSAASGQTVSVNYATADGSANAGSDYISTNGTVTFAPGTTSQSITVAVLGDTVNEPNETFVVNLSNPVNATLADNQAIGTINNDEALPGIVINDVNVVEGDSGTTNAIFTVRLSAASAQTVSVGYRTADGTASALDDYVSTNGVVTFAPGTTTQTLTVVVNGDTVNEPAETFFVNLTLAVNATISDSQGVGTILNDDGPPTLSIADVAVTEGNSGTSNALFTVTLSVVSAQTVTVDYATANGTAIAGSDYVSTSGTLTFDPGVTAVTVAVPVIGDVVNEANETFFLNLSNPVNATVDVSQGVCTILNDDALPNLSINDVTVTEGNSGTTNANFTVTLSPASGQTVIVDYATASNTALAGSDFISTNGTLIFAPGVTSQTLTVKVNGDLVNEGNETFFVNLSNAGNAAVNKGQGVGTINNDDTLPALTITDVGVVEGNSGATNAVFSVRLSVVSGQTVSVNYATADGLATAGVDYIATNGTVNFAPGVTTQTVTVAVLGDSLNESNETFFVNLSGAVNATLSDNQGLGTITNDDPVVAISISDAGVFEGNSGTTNMNFVVTLSGVSGQTVTVNYATANGTTTGNDYVTTNGTVRFAPGQTNQIITIRVNGDANVETNETVFVNLSSAVNASIADTQGVGTILNDDGVPSITITDVTVTEGNSGTANAVFNVRLSASFSQVVTVNYATADGSAMAGLDYIATNGLVSFPTGTTNQTITVRVIGDLLNEPNETFFVNLSSSTNGLISDAQAVGTINNDDPLPALSVIDASVTEGNAGINTLLFTVSLSAPSGQSVSVNYATADGTASAASDYIATNGTITLPPGSTTATVLVSVLSDTLNEADETVLLNLSNPLNATIADNQGVGTIINDDPVPSVSISDVSGFEGNSGTTNAVFTVTLSEVSGQTIIMSYATANGTAVAGSDYIPTNGIVSIPAGTLSQTITVRVNGDLLNEADETFFVNLSNPGNVTIADGQGIGTIINDDPLPALSVNDVAVSEGNNGTNAVFTITLSPVSGQPVTVTFSTADGSAVAGADYVGTNVLVTFPAGVTTQTVTVGVLGDVINEANETFTVNLSNPANATLARSQGVGTINNDDPLPTISINDVAVTEGNSGTINAVFTVSLSAVSGQTVTMNYATADGTAAAGADYFSTNGTVTFTPGTTSQSITVRVIGDVINEANETFFVNLSNPVNGTLADNQGLGTINNDDPQPNLSISDVAVSEGNSGTINALFTVSLSAVSGQTITVNYATADGTATAGSDYVAANGVLTFAPGTTSQTVGVPVIGDLINEANETFFVNLSGAVNAGISDNQGVGTINNDDPLPTLSINDVAVTEGDSGTTDAVFTVSLSTVSGQNVTVNYATANGSAVAGADYVSTNGTLSFAPGTISQTIVVKVIGDVINEINETFLVNLSSPSNAILGDGQGVGTINNDDPLPAVSIADTSVVEGNSGTINALFTVSLSAVSGQTVTINYATANGTATAGSDYVSTNGTLTFAPGTVSQTITVRINGDIINEVDETFIVSLSNPVNATLADTQATGTIMNDDPLPTLSINNATVTEGNSGTTDAVFTVTLSAPSSKIITVNYFTEDDVALGGSDFVGTNGTLTFAPGVSGQTLTVKVFGDTVNEPNETFFVTLADATNAFVGAGSGLGTINNDDPLPGVTVNDVTVSEGDSGSTNAIFIVSLIGGTEQTVTLNFATSDGTATAGQDYVASNGTLRFSPGVTSQTVVVSVLGDVLNEANETFFLNLSNPTNATITRTQGRCTINNNDPLPTLSINDVAVTEGNSGTTDALFTLALSAVSGQSITVNYATSSGTAIGGSDYISTNGTVTFAPGVTVQTIVVKVIGELLNETDETFFVNLSNPTNAVLADTQATGTILNDDPLPALSINDVTVTEGNSGTTNANFTVSLSVASGQAVTVAYATSSGSASAGTDFVSTSGLLSFAPGATAQTLTVRVNGDLLNEANETFLVTLSNPTSATLNKAQGVGTISNDDPLPAITISDAGVTEGNSGTTNAIFAVSLSAASGQSVNVNFATADGSAAAGLDYLATNGVVTFAPGVTSQSIVVPVLGDTLNEANEIFFVNLSTPVNATLADTQGVGTITNDDPVVSIFIADTAVFEGNSGTTNAQFLVTLSAASGQTVSATYATADGTATRTGDYNRINSGVVTFPPGTTSQIINVVVNGDTTVETNETFFVTLSSPVNATLGNTQAQGTILNDDGVPSLSINDVTVAEGDSGTTNATFTVRLSAAYSDLVSVRFATADGSATGGPTQVAGVDYIATNGVLNFAPGTISQTITVRVLGDLLNESSETFFVNLFNPTNAIFTDTQGVGTIIDNDPLSLVLSTNSVAVPEGATNGFNIRLSAQPPGNLLVTTHFTSGDTDLSISGGATLLFTPANWNVFQPVLLSAANDDDAVNGQAFFTVSAPGVASQTVTVNEIDNYRQALVVSTVQNQGEVPTITALQLSGPNTLISFTTVSSNRYRLERSDDVANGPWLVAVDNIPGTGGILQASDIGGASHSHQFYRIRLLNPSLAVPEGQTTNFTVQLAAQPANNVSVTITRASGSTNLNVTGGSTLTFTPANWNVPQPVLITAAEDADTTDESAQFTVSSAGLSNQTVTVTEIDNDLPNLTRCPGETAIFSVTPSGIGPFTYIWSKNGVPLEGQTNSSLVLSNVTSLSAGTYSVQVRGASYIVTKVGTLTVNVSTSSSQLNNVAACPGSTASFTIVASGTGPFTFQWRKNGTAINGATSSTLSLPNVSASDAATYCVVVTGLCNAVTNCAALTVLTPFTATGPNGLTNCPGTSANFAVVPTGSGPITYQWRKNGTAINGATSSTFSLPNVGATDAATYCVVVTGPCNAVTNCATLTVLTPVTATGPNNLTNCPGTTASFTEAGSGSGPISYQWRKNGTDINGAISSTLSLPNVSASDAAPYCVVVTGPCNAVTNCATLTVLTPVTATGPNSLTNCPGTTASFSVAASGSGPINYQWRKNGTAINGATGSTLSLPNVSATDAATYCVVVTGPCNAVTNCASLTVLTPVAATTPRSLTNCPGSSATFATIASGSGPFTYQWTKDGTDVLRATNSSLMLLGLSAGDAGSYCVIVSGACDSVVKCATLTVLAPLSLSGPTDSTNCPGTTASFSVEPLGSGPFTYQWSKDGTNAVGATNSSLTLLGVAADDAGTYCVVVRGPCDVLTNCAVLTVSDCPMAGSPAPAAILTLVRTGNQITISWPCPCDGLVLEAATSLNPLDWQPVEGTASIVNGFAEITLPADQPVRFFRLHSK